MSITPLTVPPKKLAQTISASAMTFKMNNIEGWNEADLTPADFGTEAFGVFINSTRTQIEIFSFDPATIADSEITILQRGLGYSGQLVEDAARKYPWASNDTTIQLGTDAPQLFRDFVSESNTQTITALHTYDVLPQSTETPSNDEDFTTKAYVDGLTEPAITVPVNQVAHGLTVGQVIRVNGANLFTPAQANTATGSEVVGIVSEVVDVDNFKYITEGVFEDASAPAFAAGTVVFLSRTVAGELTDTDTTTIGEVSAPLGIIVENGARMIFHRYRPAVINTISGNPIASETVAGTVEQATPAQAAAGVDTGETGAPLFVVPSLISSPKVERTVEAFDNIDGSVTPKAVSEITGSVLNAGAIGRFSGFVTENVVADTLPTFLNAVRNTTVGTQSVTANAGTDRVMVVNFAMGAATGVTPSSVTWNGVTFTLLEIVNLDANNRIGTWIGAIGTSGSNQTFNLVTNGSASGGIVVTHSVIYENVDQANPVQATDTKGVLNTSGLQTSDTLSPTSVPYNLVVAFALEGYGSSITINNAGLNLQINQAQDKSGDFAVTGSTAIQVTPNGSNRYPLFSGVMLKTSLSGTSTDIQSTGKVAGFTGLTPNVDYFRVDDTGAVSPTGDGAYVGTATSATEILIPSYEPLTKACAIYQNAPSSAPGYNSTALVPFQVTDFDTGGFVTSDTRITVPSDGLYLIGCNIKADENNFSIKAILRKNGTTRVATQGFNDGFGIDSGVSLVILLSLVAGDYFEVLHQHSGGGSTDTSGDEGTNFWIKKV